LSELYPRLLIGFPEDPYLEVAMDFRSPNPEAARARSARGL